MCVSSFHMASTVTFAAFQLPFITRRLSDPSPRVWLSHSTIRLAHIRRFTMDSPMSQQTGEIDASSRNDENSGEKPDDVVVQYVVLRRDLIDSWPLGSVVTQGCHASVAPIWSFKDDPVTLEVKGENDEFVREAETMDGAAGEYSESEVYRH